MSLVDALFRLRADLEALRVKWALIGGFAVSVYARPRATLDLDLAVSVSDDREAERLCAALGARGYELVPQHAEQEQTGRLAFARLLLPSRAAPPTPLDLMFAHSGIEPEVVDGAQQLELTEGLRFPVARVGHLIALKILAGRPQDRVDVLNLLEISDGPERQRAREALELIERRGCGRRRDLLAEYDQLVGR